MPLTVGSRIGPYEVLAALGAGGMGEVYRARDSKLNRDVALKVLPDAFVGDPDRLARFKREAQVLAALNHPHIGAIYGFQESAESGQALVLELVEGPTLADRLSHGPVPLAEALAIARQIAEALQAAHDHGIVHRDLKPANIKVRDDGTVKVLDFGLARVAETSAASDAAAAASPTITSPAMLTGAGMLLGTAAYMSPEQAKGRPADKRSDVWAFGCVVYEMLTGRRAFPGDDVGDTLAAVLRAEPDWNALPAATPSSVVATLKGCLQKSHKHRIGDIAVPLFVFDTPSIDAAPEPPRGHIWWKYGAAALLMGLVIAAIAGFTALRYAPAPSRPISRFAISLPEGQVMGSGRGGNVGLSPDGSEIAYIANGQIHVRSMSEFGDRVVAGAEGVGLQSPTFSPDGGSIAFFANRAIQRVATSGGAAVTICRVEEGPLGLSWTSDGIIFGAGAKGVMRVSASGGTPETLVALQEGELANAPQLLPGGKQVLFTLAGGSPGPLWEGSKVVVQSLGSGARKVLVDGGNFARYVPTGHLVYAVGGVLLGVPLDLSRSEVVGAPVPVVEGVRRSNNTGAVHFAFAESGALVYVPGPATVSRTTASLAFVDSEGRTESLKLPAGPYEHPRLAPDGKRVVFATDDGTDADISVYDLDQSSAPRRLTFAGKNRYPIWTPDGRRITFQSTRGGDNGIYWQRADGGGDAERLTTADADSAHAPESWSPNGELLLFSITKGATVSLWSYSTRTKQIAAVGGIQSSLPTNATFSPDGRWIAYTANEQGRFGVYAQPFPPTGAKFLVSRDQGISPVWSRDGRELYFNFPGQLMKARIATQPIFSHSPAIGLPNARGGIDMTWPAQRTYDVSADGRTLGIVPFGSTAAALVGTELRVVLNWTEELKQRLPTR